MIIFLSIIFICILAGYVISQTDRDWKKKGVRFKIGAIWATSLSVVWCIITALIINQSYNTYLKQRAFYDATVEQYSTAITMYEDKAVIDIEDAAWTDLKYQGYQENISKLILDLRHGIIKYNTRFIKMSKKANNPFYSWLVIDMADDMKIIKMRTARQKARKAAAGWARFNKREE